MKRIVTPVAAVAATALLAAPLGSPTAQAATSGGTAAVYQNLYAAAPCDYAPKVTVPSAGRSLADNGAWVAYDRAGTSTVTSSGAQVATLSVAASLRARLTPVGRTAARFDLTATAQVTATRRSANSCQVTADTAASVKATVRFARPTWVTYAISASAAGPQAPVSFSLRGPDVFGGTLEAASSWSRTQLLAAGDYALESSVGAWTTAQGSTRTGRATISATFTPIGSATSAAVGRASAMVPLAGSRDCARGTVRAAITKRARKKAKRVGLFVNGARAATLKGKRLAKARSVTLRRLPATARVTVRAVVVPKHGRKRTTIRSYAACR